MLVQPHIDDARCARCGRCVEACPSSAVRLEDKGPVFNCTEDMIRLCTDKHNGFICLGEEICPNGVIAWEFEIVFEDDPAADR